MTHLQLLIDGLDFVVARSFVPVIVITAKDLTDEDHRRLNGRLVGSHDWQEFEGTSELILTMNGQGTFDDNWLDLPGGAYRAMTMRAYDPTTQTWSIWWLDARDPHAPLDPPVNGSFKDGVGTFECDSTLNDKPIRVRYRWSRTDTASPRWEQSFSPDGGKSWEVNWEMDFTRATQ